MNNKIIIIIATACFFLVFGLGVGYVFSQKKIQNNEKVSVCSDFDAGWKELEKRARESGRCDVGPLEIRVISGKVIEKKDNSLIIKIVLFDPFSDPSLDAREITFDNNTEIIRKAVKGEEQINKEMKEYNERHSIQKDGESYYLNMPRKEFEKNIDFSDINIGDKISVRSELDIRDSKQILAQKITIR